MPYSFKVIKVYEGTAETMYELERQLKKINKANKYMPRLKFGGMTECFTNIIKN